VLIHTLSGGVRPASTQLFLLEEAASSIVFARPIDMGYAGRIMVRPEGTFAYPTLVWKPCLESLSPYYPFRMFIVGTRHLYVRADGRVVTELHDDVRGV
jgi:hypothetical protein